MIHRKGLAINLFEPTVNLASCKYFANKSGSFSLTGCDCLGYSISNVYNGLLANRLFAFEEFCLLTRMK